MAMMMMKVISGGRWLSACGLVHECPAVFRWILTTTSHSLSEAACNSGLYPVALAVGDTPARSHWGTCCLFPSCRWLHPTPGRGSPPPTSASMHCLERWGLQPFFLLGWGMSLSLGSVGSFLLRLCFLCERPWIGEEGSCSEFHHWKW